MPPPRFEVIGVEGLDEIQPGDDIAHLLVEAARRQATPPLTGDLLVVGQKIVSKAEGRLLRLTDVTPSPAATAMAATLGRDARQLEGVEVGVIVADTFGRPWREGLTNVAIGVSGVAPLRSYLGQSDPAGRE